MIGSPGWFKLFSYTHVALAMKDEKEAGVAVAILARACTFASETVIALVKKVWLQNAAFDWYTWQVLQECPRWNDDVTAIAKTIIERTDIASFAIDQMVAVVGVNQPETALELSSCALSRQLSGAIKEAEELAKLAPPDDDSQRMIWYMTKTPSKPLTDVLEKRDGWDSLEAIAKAHGGLFIQYLWPRFQETLAALRQVDNNSSRVGFSLPYVLDFHFPEEHSRGVGEPPLLGAFATAIAAFACDNETEFLQWLSVNEHEDAAPAQRLLAHALASEPLRYAARAARFLLNDKRRFYLGSVEDSRSTTKRLISVASPHWPDDLLTEFVDDVMAFKPPLPSDVPAKSRQHFGEVFRRTKLTVLSALPVDRLSKQVRRYIEEEHRRFPRENMGATLAGPIWIGSPMSAQNMAQATDAEVLNAFRKLPDASNWDHPKQWMKGGNIQLSREFAEFARTHPKRAIQLIQHFEPAFGSRGAGYALDAMAESVEPKEVLELIEALSQRGFSSSEFRDSTATAVGRLIRRDVRIDDRTLSLLESWLIEPAGKGEHDDGDDGDEDPKKTAKGKKEEEPTGSVLWGHGGISILPHGRFSILETLTRALLGREEHDELVSFYKKHLSIDEGREVWQALLQFFRYIHPTDVASFGDFILELFKRYPGLAVKREAAIMLAHLHWKLPEVVHQLISTWRDASSRELQQAYGELVALVALVQPNLRWAREMLAGILESPGLAPARAGAAYTAVNLWAEADTKYRSAASGILQEIIPKADQATWSAIFDLFRLVDEITPEQEWITFLQVLSKHLDKPNALDSSFVVERLQTLLPHQASLVADIAKGLVANWCNELGDLRTGTAMVARELVDLAITLHRLGPDTRDVGTSLFEDLLHVSAYTARETLDEIDNRFRTAPGPARRRLPRRTTRPVRQAQRSA